MSVALPARDILSKLAWVALAFVSWSVISFAIQTAVLMGTPAWLLFSHAESVYSSVLLVIAAFFLIAALIRLASAPRTVWLGVLVFVVVEIIRLGILAVGPALGVRNPGDWHRLTVSMRFDVFLSMLIPQAAAVAGAFIGQRTVGP